MTAGSLLEAAMAAHGADRRDVSLLLAELIGCAPLELGLLKDRDVTEEQASLFWQFHRRLLNNEPPQYILGKSWFYGLEFEVNPAVLIPRPETEGLVELALSYARPGMRVLEIGTGSGAIAIALASNANNVSVTATDISLGALEVASRNALRHACDIDFRLADLFPDGDGVYDLLISNPPYVSAAEYAELPPRVRQFEPREALFAAEEGLSFYRRILAEAASRLVLRGLVCFEHGAGQRSRIQKLAEEYGYICLLAKQDLPGRDRYLLLQRAE